MEKRKNIRVNGQINRRHALLAGGAGILVGALNRKFSFARIESRPLKIGILLPYSGVYAHLGESIDAGFMLAVQAAQGQFGGRAIQMIKIDSEAAPAKSMTYINKLVHGEKVDILVGPVHSGVAMAMVKATRQANTVVIIPNAGANQITRQYCGAHIFRTSFTHWQVAYPTGWELAKQGVERVVLCYWNYSAGKQAIQGFEDGFLPGGGKIIQSIAVPFPNVSFQAVLTKIASLSPDAVFVFFSGSGAIKFVKDYAAAGLKGRIPLYGSFLTEGLTMAQGEASEGLESVLHYADDLDFPESVRFRESYQAAKGRLPDVHAVQGYDAASLLRVGLEAVEGDIRKRENWLEAMASANLASPRGPFALSQAHNPIQNFYLRKVDKGLNRFVRLVAQGLSDTGAGCMTQ